MALFIAKFYVQQRQLSTFPHIKLRKSLHIYGISLWSNPNIREAEC